MRKIRVLLLLSLFQLSFQFIGQTQVLNIPETIQEQTNWCWAATSKCVLDFFGFVNLQCEIAEYTRTVATWHSFGNINCCTNPNQGCNYWNYNWGYPGSIEDILDHFGNIHTINMGTYLTLAEIQTEIEASRPFIFRWGWYSGGGHFLVGHGLSGTDIYYMNPLPGYGYEIADYTWLIDDGSHVWTHTQTLCLPSIPGQISGDTEVCPGSVHVYSINSVEGATSYKWTLPVGWHGNSNTTSILTTTGILGGEVSVAASNSCGTSIPQKLLVSVTVVDTSVTQSGATLTANAISADYQWISCPSMQIIQGETSQSITPTQNGSYGVIVSQNNCSDTSNCHNVIVNNIQNSGSGTYLYIYPNPANDKIVVETSLGFEKVAVFNAIGEIVRENALSVNKALIDLSGLSKGLYWVKASNSQVVVIKPFVIN